MNAFHSGCIGDIIYSIPTLHKLNVESLFIADRPWTKPIVNRIGAFDRILESQGIKVKEHKGEKIDYDLSTYRSAGHKYGETIVSKIARWVNVHVDVSEKSIRISDKTPYTKGKIVVGRCPRWHGENFPWKEIVEQYGSDIVFIGLPEEYKAFTKEFGNVDYYHTIDLYDVAEAINGCDIYFGNQSSPMAICEGLKHDCVQECCLYAFDCVYHRGNKVHVIDGNFTFTHKGRVFDYKIEPPKHGYKITVNGFDFHSIEKDVCVTIARAYLTMNNIQCNIDSLKELVKLY